MKSLRLIKGLRVLCVALVAAIFSMLGIVVINYSNKTDEPNNNETMEILAFDGAGTAGNPYKIYSISDMEMLSTNIYNGADYYNTYFQLQNDLDYSEKNFVPIGAKIDEGRYDFKPFSGIFDGNGYTISNINIKGDSLGTQDNVSFGLFACLGGGMYAIYPSSTKLETSGFYEYSNTIQVKNLQLYNFNAALQENGSGSYSYVGTIAGLSYTGVHECLKEINGTSDDYKIISSVEISNCIVNNVNLDPQEKGYAGGLVGIQMTHLPSDGGGNMREETKLSIKNCMVWNALISADQGVCAYISPARGFIGENEMFDWKVNKYLLGMNYDIEYCITNSRGVVSIVGSANSLGEPPCIIDRTEYPYDDLLGNIDNVYDLNTFRSTADVFTNNNADNWTKIDEYDKFTLYLKTFVTSAEWRVTPENCGGTISFSGDDSLTTFNIPKVPGTSFNDNLSSNKITIYSYRTCDYDETFTETGYNEYESYLEAKDPQNGNYKFYSWTITTNTSPMVFTAQFISEKCTLTFQDSIAGELIREGNSEYEIATLTEVEVIITSFGKRGAVKACEFKFKPYGETGKVVVKYTLVGNLRYMSQVKLGEKLCVGSSGYQIKSDTAISIVVSLKTYTPNFE